MKTYRTSSPITYSCLARAANAVWNAPPCHDHVRRADYLALAVSVFPSLENFLRAQPFADIEGRDTALLPVNAFESELVSALKCGATIKEG